MRENRKIKVIVFSFKYTILIFNNENIKAVTKKIVIKAVSKKDAVNMFNSQIKYRICFECKYLYYFFAKTSELQRYTSSNKVVISDDDKRNSLIQLYESILQGVIVKKNNLPKIAKTLNNLNATEIATLKGNDCEAVWIVPRWKRECTELALSLLKAGLIPVNEAKY